MAGGKRPWDGPGSSNYSGGQSDSPRQKFRKGERSRRMWTPREEEILAETLLELVARGWKSDNGFRMGYLSKIEDSLRAEFPKCDLKGTPHITSKISSWKKSYGCLRSILGRSGIGFNTDGEYKIDCNDDQWDQIVQADKDARGMRTKSWPFWETWKSIFGKDRASGRGAEQVNVAAARVNAHLAGASQSNENYYYPSFENFPVDPTTPVAETPDSHDVTSGQSGKQASTNKTSTEISKKGGGDSALMEFLGNLHAETNARLEMIAGRIGYEFDMGKKREEVFDKLGTVEGLTLKQRYELCNILGDKPQRLEVFMGMPPPARLGYVLLLIDENKKEG